MPLITHLSLLDFDPACKGVNGELTVVLWCCVSVGFYHSSSYALAEGGYLALLPSILRYP